MSATAAVPATIKAEDIPNLLRDHLSPLIAEQIKASIDQARKDAGKPRPVEAAQMERAKGEELKRAKTSAARFMRAFIAGRGNKDAAADIAAKQFGDEVVGKALGESVFVDGGAVVPPSFASEIIEVLRAETVVRSLGAREVPMPNGTLTMPFGNAGVTAYAVAENSNVLPGQGTFGQLTMRAHKIMAIVPVSNDLLMDASPLADQFVQDDMVAALTVLEDQYFVRGTGTGNQVRGLKNWAATTLTSSNVATGAGNSTTAEVIKDLMLLMSSVESLNIRIKKGGWIFAPRTKYALMGLKDNQGNFYFKEEMRQGLLWGQPFRSSTVQPINLNDVGSLSSKETEVCYADFDKILVGNTGELSVVPFLGGSYHDGSNIISGISQDQTIVAGKLRSDLGARFRGAEIAWLKGVTWGA